MDDAHPTRICTCCRQPKPANRDYFHAHKRAPDGCRAVCRLCRAADHAAHRSERLPLRREHYHANRERLIEVSKDYYRRHVEEQRALALDRHYQNREHRLAQMRKHLAENRDEINALRRPIGRAMFHARYGVDLEFTLKHRLRALIRATLVRGRDGVRMRDVLGYGALELRAHLERQFLRGMSWDKFLAGEIHVDHIIPAAHFHIERMDSPAFKACWCLSNLRPMWASDNLSKGAKVLTLI